MITTYQITTSSYRDILVVKIVGHANRDNADAIAGAVIGSILQHDPPSVLVDTRYLEGRLGTAETFFHVRSYPQDIPRYRTAIVDREENRSYCEFYELTSRNLGHNIRCFYKIEDALEWLSTETAQPMSRQPAIESAGRQ